MTSRCLPVLFSSPMVRALLREVEQPGTGKTQTRRVLVPQPAHLQVYDWKGKRLLDSEYRHWCWRGHVGADNWDEITEQLKPHLPYAAGDRLWVREAWRTFVSQDNVTPRDLWAPGCGHGAGILYDADSHGLAITKDGERWNGPRDDPRAFGKFRPPMFMPRWASRLTLTVTDVRVQRLQDISEADAFDEGAEKLPTGYFSYTDDFRAIPCRLAFENLWDSLNAAHGYGWDTNPWVVAYTFTVRAGNVDEMAS